MLLPDNNYKASISTISDYIALMKPRVMSLVIFTSFCAIILARAHIHPFIAFMNILCISGGAGSAAVFNMWYDRDIDNIMQRTKYRPLVVGTISPDNALSFGLSIGFISIFFMILCAGVLAASLLLFTIVYYFFVYTVWLKRTSPQNVVIGGVAGALPPVIGWSSVTGSISIESLVLFLIIMLWTPPHSWALVLYRAKDYKDCKIPMMPLVKGTIYTKKLMLCYSALMFLATIMPYYLSFAGFVYLAIAIILGSYFIYLNLKIDVNNPAESAKKLFLYSIFYLFIIFASLLIQPFILWLYHYV